MLHRFFVEMVPSCAVPARQESVGVVRRVGPPLLDHLGVGELGDAVHAAELQEHLVAPPGAALRVAPRDGLLLPPPAAAGLRQVPALRVEEAARDVVVHGALLDGAERLGVVGDHVPDGLPPHDAGRQHGVHARDGLGVRVDAGAGVVQEALAVRLRPVRGIMVKYALKTMPAKRKNILDVYRDFKKKDPNYAYAFGDEQFFTFYMADAHHVHDVLPDMRIEHERYDFLKVHKLLFLPLAAKLQMLGVKTAMVARTKTPQGNYTYSVSARSDDGAQ